MPGSLAAGLRLPAMSHAKSAALPRAAESPSEARGASPRAKRSSVRGPSLKKPTIRVVAAKAGVAVSTVSRYLNDDSVSLRMKARLSRVIASLGYTPSQNSAKSESRPQGLYWRCGGLDSGSLVHAAADRHGGGAAIARHESDAPQLELRTPTTRRFVRMD